MLGNEIDKQSTHYYHYKLVHENPFYMSWNTTYFLQISITADNIGTVINNLTAIITTTNETADQNTDNLQVIQRALTKTAALFQNASVPLAVVEQVSWCACVQYWNHVMDTQIAY